MQTLDTQACHAALALADPAGKDAPAKTGDDSHDYPLDSETLPVMDPCPLDAGTGGMFEHLNILARQVDFAFDKLSEAHKGVLLDGVVSKTEGAEDAEDAEGAPTKHVCTVGPSTNWSAATMVAVDALNEVLIGHTIKPQRTIILGVFFLKILLGFFA